MNLKDVETRIGRLELSKQQVAEKARLKLLERERGTVAVGVIRIKR